MATMRPPQFSARLSALVVFPWCLDEVGHGNIQRVLGFARYLVRKGVEVDLVYQGREGLASREHELVGFRRILRVGRWQSSDERGMAESWKTFYSGMPEPHAMLMAGGALTMAVRGLLEANDYNAVISTYAWTAPIFSPLSPGTLRICDTQDILHVHGQRSQKATGDTSAFWMPEETERFLWRKWDALIAISPEEADMMQPWLRPAQRLITMGHATRIPKRVKPSGTHIVYTGSDNPSNRAAITWFLQEVWPKVLAVRPKAKLKILGLICYPIADTPLAQSKNVTLGGFVENVEAELSAASIVIAPYRYGSGLKIKIIEAAAAGRPIVTTPNGLEGSGMTPGTHLMVEQEADGFAKALVRLISSPALRQQFGDAARRFVKETFSDDATYGPLLDLLAERVDMGFKPGVIPSTVFRRIQSAVDAIAAESPRIVIWGNGSHTRGLIHVLEALGRNIVRCIVDKSAKNESRSPEGLRVIASRHFKPAPGDLIVLSSQVFEAEMWSDLERIRKAGTHVLGVYRKEFVTEALRGKLEAPQQRTALRHRTASANGRLIFVEPGAGRLQGPFFRQCHAMRDASGRNRTEVIVAGSRVASLRGMEPHDHELLDQAFEFSYWDALNDIGSDAWGAVSRYARCMAADLGRMTERLQLGPKDAVLFNNGNIVELLGAAQWLSSLKRDQMPWVRFLFHFLTADEARFLKVTEAEARNAYALTLALLSEQAGDRLKLLAQTSTLAGLLAREFNRPVHPLGFPLTAGLRGTSSIRPASPARLLYAGEARADKGFGMLPAVADALAPELKSGKLTLVCHSMLSEFADEATRRAAAAMKSRQGVEIVNGFLPSRDYDRLVAGCDLVLLPYSAELYRSRMSAIFVDATSAGMLPIVPADTWMADQLAAGYGVGETFGTLSGRAIAGAVRKMLRRLSLKKQQARRAIDRVGELHDPRNVLQTILKQEAPTVALSGMRKSA
jgi:glycosyltransferase involved in cell wall biosynthesis